jgi:TIR domain
MKIILSYRRTDSAGIAGRIFDRFVSHFGADRVFMDIDNIPFGIDFREHIKVELGNSDAVLVIMGSRWLSDAGVRRIDNENDLVRIEVETALHRGIPVIPVLVDGATMPLPEELPDSVRGLVFRNAAALDSGRDFNTHIDRLIRSISRLAEKPAVRERAIERPAAPPGAAAAVDDSDVAIAGASRAVSLVTPTSPQLRDSSAVQTEEVSSRSIDQLEPIRSARQVPVWMVAVAGCALIVTIWFTFRYLIIRHTDQAAAGMLTIFDLGKIELVRKIVAPPPPPPPPKEVQGKSP